MGLFLKNILTAFLLFGLVYGETWLCVPTLRVDEDILEDVDTRIFGLPFDGGSWSISNEKNTKTVARLHMRIFF